MVFLTAALVVLQYYRPHLLFKRPFAAGSRLAILPEAVPSPLALGKSGDVRIRLALPGEAIDYPLDVEGDPTALAYDWVRAGETVPVDSARALLGSAVTVPTEPGFYQLALVRDSVRRVVEGLTVAVQVPFAEKVGGALHGYRIGTYLAEKLAAKSRPEGFLEVEAGDVDLPLSTHLRIGDFLVRDGQTTWPRYVALNPRLLDKLELVIGKLSEWHGDSTRLGVTVDVNSGYRSPAYNRTVPRSARDSRHQYGDAADVAIDANGDGRVNLADTKLVALAVEAVERDHPELVGGMGIYTSARYRRPYVHIDARGQRARWRG